jgi:hypothetical protein
VSTRWEKTEGYENRSEPTSRITVEPPEPPVSGADSRTVLAGKDSLRRALRARPCPLRAVLHSVIGTTGGSGGITVLTSHG